jgi:hypothetical protein
MLDIFNQSSLFMTNITSNTSGKYSWKSYPVQRDSLATDSTPAGGERKAKAKLTSMPHSSECHPYQSCSPFGIAVYAKEHQLDIQELVACGTVSSFMCGTQHRPLKPELIENSCNKFNIELKRTFIRTRFGQNQCLWCQNGVEKSVVIAAFFSS